MAKRFILHESERYGDGIEDTQSNSSILIDSMFQCVEIMNQLHEENERLQTEKNKFEEAYLRLCELCDENGVLIPTM